MASFRNLRVQECATAPTASALGELQRAALATAQAAAATFRHWQDEQAAPQTPATANGAGSRRTKRRRQQRRSKQRHEATAEGAPTDPTATSEDAVDAAGGHASPLRPPEGLPLECHELARPGVTTAPPHAPSTLGGEIALVPKDRAKTPRPDAPPSPSSGPREAKKGRVGTQPIVDLFRRAEARAHPRGPASGAQHQAWDPPAARTGGAGRPAGCDDTPGRQGGGAPCTSA